MIDKEAIKARLDAATPGPWREGKVSGTVVSDTPQTWNDGLDYEYYGGYPICESALTGDLEFIANAPTDIAELLVEVERLEGELAKFKPCEVSKNHYHWLPDHSQEKVRVYHKEGE